MLFPIPYPSEAIVCLMNAVYTFPAETLLPGYQRIPNVHAGLSCAVAHPLPGACRFYLTKLVLTASSFNGSPIFSFPNAMLFMRKVIFLARVRIDCSPSPSSKASPWLLLDLRCCHLCPSSPTTLSYTGQSFRMLNIETTPCPQTLKTCGTCQSLPLPLCHMVTGSIQPSRS